MSVRVFLSVKGKNARRHEQSNERQDLDGHVGRLSERHGHSAVVNEVKNTNTREDLGDPVRETIALLHVGQAHDSVKLGRTVHDDTDLAGGELLSLPDLTNAMLMRLECSKKATKYSQNAQTPMATSPKTKIGA